MVVVRVIGMLLVFLIGFYLSLIFSSRSLTESERTTVDRAIAVLEERGFTDDVWMLRHAVYRGPDNWLNTLADSEGAFAKTNCPFQIITIYPEFTSIPKDDLERAAVLLHEARHLRGSSEAEAYKYVWLNRCVLDLKKGPNRPHATMYTGDYEAKMRNPDLDMSPCE